ncbi:N-acetyltransferase family protein [Thiospirochaeta perfilievii]|uniref:N-acetyltransferase family protein n=1 Tax=Thiospirochaeta perfilievii TaxID=252967 RepID=A0A5C1QES2_9SPIO|nr:arsinothricin resistance N-acetyltransferase ArsN1 family B [Thiospirochaeta perfilievii]QEN04722.1 N-acetyltransferase family protein [Thiospirochaeta perfilievii]
MIRNVNIIDSQQICDIYNHYIEHTDITFEEDPVTVVEMSERIKKVTKDMPWIVYEEDGKILGYAYASPWRVRAAYRFCAETSLYVDINLSHRGVGTKLYKQLILELKDLGIHSVLGCLAMPNDKSQGLHEKLGFTKVAHFPEVGFKFGHWIDVGYWQLNL